MTEPTEPHFTDMHNEMSSLHDLAGKSIGDIRRLWHQHHPEILARRRRIENAAEEVFAMLKDLLGSPLHCHGQEGESCVVCDRANEIIDRIEGP